ncbi:MAG: S41 family peptidase, partial [Candidatus Peregrinibacteria bacterium]|nr:S41 family peptidase [Candidatus Peregrinibacteria bacterium]
VPEDSLIESIKVDDNKVVKRTEPSDVDLDIFWETWNVLESNFLNNDQMKVLDQVYGATKGMVDSLEDPYTVFMTPEETAKFEESISGEFEGIGAEIAIKNDQLTIVSPLKGSPAELAGIRAGDIVMQIDGEQTFGITIEEAVTRIRGPKGEKVVLTMYREGEKKPLEITVVRDTIIVEAVEFEMEDDVAVITITQFGTDAAKEFQEVVKEVLLQKPRGVVIDLRNNGGGLLDVCIKIATEFFDKKIIVQTRGRKFGDSGDLISGRDGAFLEMPLVVLANKGSASASEIFVGAVKDHNRGLVLGEKTFGKGSVQNVIPLSDGSSLKVTIAEWLTPGGHSINEEGIEPDEEVEFTEEDFEEGFDPVMERALDLVGTDEMVELLKQAKDEPEEEVVEVEVSLCEEFCKQKEYETGKCLDCVILDEKELSAECESEDFFYSEETQGFCVDVPKEDNTQHGCLCE